MHRILILYIFKVFKVGLNSDSVLYLFLCCLCFWIEFCVLSYHVDVILFLLSLIWCISSWLFSLPFLQTYNEVQHCFLTVGMVYPEDLFIFLLQVSPFLSDSVIAKMCHCWSPLVSVISYHTFRINFLFSSHTFAINLVSS